MSDDLTVRPDASQQAYSTTSASKAKPNETRPTEKSDTTKNFKKILERGASTASASAKNSVEDGEEEAEALTDGEAGGSAGEKVFSLFPKPKENKLANQQFGYPTGGKVVDPKLAMATTPKPPPMPLPAPPLPIASEEAPEEPDVGENLEAEGESGELHNSGDATTGVLPKTIAPNQPKGFLKPVAERQSPDVPKEVAQYGGNVPTPAPTKASLATSHLAAQSAVPTMSPKTEMRSIFGNNKPGEKGKVKGEGKMDSPAGLFAKQAKDATTTRSLGADAGEGDMGEGQPGRTLNKKTNIATPFVREQVDISAVNPQASAFSTELASSVSSAEKAPPAQSATLTALIEQMVKQISVMTTSDKNETSILLKQPPMLDGAQLIITGFDSARGELNVKFANLTQEAQNVLVQQQHSLMTALETKGYQVHIFIATTVNEPQIITAGGQPADKERQQRESQQGQGQRQSRDEEKG